MAGKNKKKQNQAENRHDVRESDSKNRVDMLNGNQIDEVTKNPPRRDKNGEKKDEIL